MNALDELELKGKIAKLIDSEARTHREAANLLLELVGTYREVAADCGEYDEEEEEIEDEEEDDSFDEEDEDLDDLDDGFDDDEEEDDAVNVAAEEPVGEHSEGPWEVCDSPAYPYAGIDGPDFSVILLGDDNNEGGVRGNTPEQAEANARRIVACVNALAKLPTEEIERFIPESFIDDEDGATCQVYDPPSEDTELTALPADERHKSAWWWLETRGFHLVRTGDQDFPQYRLRGGNCGWTPKHSSNTPFGCVRQAMAEELDRDLAGVTRHASVESMWKSILGEPFAQWLTELTGSQVRRLAQSRAKALVKS